MIRLSINIIAKKQKVYYPIIVTVTLIITIITLVFLVCICILDPARKKRDFDLIILVLGFLFLWFPGKFPKINFLKKGSGSSYPPHKPHLGSLFFRFSDQDSEIHPKILEIVVRSTSAPCWSLQTHES